VIKKPESAIIETISRLLVPFVQMFGLYVIMHGHSSPGGGFQGGVILGASFILLAVGCGIEEMNTRFPLRALTLFMSAGVMIYGGIGLLCLLLGANYLDYGILPVPEPRSIGMLGIEIGVGITVMAVMISIFRDLIMFE
jgi:multicomponent Na+:H+ antiporter subunit B